MVSLENYQALEAQDTIRYEYENGTVRAMVGDTLRHNQMVLNCYRSLYNIFDKEVCDVFTENVKLEVTPKQIYYYPDVMVVCDPEDNDSAIVKQPFIIIEVLSDSTEKVDLRNKAEAYGKIKSLAAYIIVDQKKPWVRVYTHKGDFWIHEDITDLEQSLAIPELKTPIALKEIYASVF